MSPLRPAFRDWRHRLEELQESEGPRPARSWAGKLHAKVLKYFIARYEYPPLPEPPTARLGRFSGMVGVSSSTRMVLRRPTETAPGDRLQPAQIRAILSEIHGHNADRERYIT